MKAFLKNHHGQATAVEYAVLFILVVAAIAAMSTYVSRAIQARSHGARNYMVDQVKAQFPDLDVKKEYEPYYVTTETNRAELSETTVGQTPWAGHEGRFDTGVSSATTSQTKSTVAPAGDAN